LTNSSNCEQPLDNQPTNQPTGQLTNQSSNLPTKYHRPLFLVLAVFLILATAYNVAVPLLEKPDEKWHYPYLQNIADGRKAARARCITCWPLPPPFG